MPGISVWMIRLSFGYLITGLALGAAMLINKAVMISDKIWLLLPVHIEILIFGWIIQFTLGTAYWILPRFLINRDRGRHFYALFMVIALNVGILLVAISSFVGNSGMFALFGRVLEAVAVILFAALHWRRVVSYGALE